MAPHAERRLQAAQRDNPYTRGAKLSQLIANEVVLKRAEIRSDVHKLFDSRQSDRFCSNESVRERVLVRLVDLMLDELLQLGNGSDAEAKRRLKTLTALTTLSGDAKQRSNALQNIRDGSTASFPYVLKYLTRGVCPCAPSFPDGLEITLSGFGAAVESRFPEAEHIRICLDRYIQREGVITRFVDPDGPIAPGLEEKYGSSPSYHLRRDSGLLVPKSVAITEYRRDELRVPDGIVLRCELWSTARVFIATNGNGTENWGWRQRSRLGSVEQGRPSRSA